MIDVAVQRPEHGVPPDGYRYEAVESVDVRLLERADFLGRNPALRCRGAKDCAGLVVMAMSRPRHSYRTHRTSLVEYRYCVDHLYGRWIEDGKIMCWRLVADDD